MPANLLAFGENSGVVRNGHLGDFGVLVAQLSSYFGTEFEPSAFQIKILDYVCSEYFVTCVKVSKSAGKEEIGDASKKPVPPQVSGVGD